MVYHCLKHSFKKIDAAFHLKVVELIHLSIILGKNEIEDYLRKTKVTSLVGLDMKTKIHKIKTKIFNERKTSRERVSQKLSKLMSN